MTRAAAHDAFFSGLLDRIPHRLTLLRSDAEEEQETGAARYFKVLPWLCGPGGLAVLTYPPRT